MNPALIRTSFLTRLRLATHEAGHAIMGLALGASPSVVSIIPEDGGPGSLGESYHPTLPDAPPVTTLLVLLGGAESESEWLRQRSLRCENLEGWSGSRFAGSDHDVLLDLLAKVSDDEDVQRRALAALRDSASAILQRTWPAVDAVAEELERRDWLSGDRVRQLANDACPHGLPDVRHLIPRLDMQGRPLASADADTGYGPRPGETDREYVARRKAEREAKRQGTTRPDARRRSGVTAAALPITGGTGWTAEQRALRQDHATWRDRLHQVANDAFASGKRGQIGPIM